MIINPKVTPFRFWSQKVLPLVYDDSLSYYEVLCKLTGKVNELIKFLDVSDSSVYSRAKKFNTTVEMLSADVNEGDICLTSGYSNVLDGYGGIFYIGKTEKRYALQTEKGLYALLLSTIVDLGQYNLYGTDDITDTIEVLLEDYKAVVISESVTGDFKCSQGNIISGNGTINGDIELANGVIIHGVTIIGAVYAENCQDFEVNNCTISGSEYGVYCTKVKNANITANTITDCSNTGVYVEGDLQAGGGLAGNAPSVFIERNSIDLCNNGIKCYAISESGIKNNHVYRTERCGIEIIDSNRVDVEGNIVTASSATNPNFGIRLYGPDRTAEFPSPYNTYIFVHDNIIQYTKYSGILVEGFALNNKIESNTLTNTCLESTNYNSPILVLGSTYGDQSPYRHIQGTEIRNNRIIYLQGGTSKPEHVTWDIRTLNSILDVIEGNISDYRPLRVNVGDMTSAYINNGWQMFTSFELTALNADTTNLISFYYNEGNNLKFRVSAYFTNITDDVELILPFNVGDRNIKGLFYDSNTSSVWGGVRNGSQSNSVLVKRFDGQSLISGQQYTFIFETQSPALYSEYLDN